MTQNLDQRRRVAATIATAVRDGAICSRCWLIPEDCTCTTATTSGDRIANRIAC